MQNVLKYVGNIKCGQIALFSIALNALLLSMLTVVMSAPDNGADVGAKAAALEQARQSERRQAAFERARSAPDAQPGRLKLPHEIGGSK